MPLLNGMDAARELRQRDKSVKIIFLTSSPEFALESYEVKAQGYVLKPIAYDKLKKLLDEMCPIICRRTKEHGDQNCHRLLQKLYFMKLNTQKLRIREFSFICAPAIS